MRNRVLKWLKLLALDDNETFKLFGIPDDKKECYAKKAEQLIEEIFLKYKDFQIKTIDSFLISIFKRAAIDLGKPIDFEILMNNRDHLTLAFEIYLNNIQDSKHSIFKVIDIINENEQSFSYVPTNKIFQNIIELYKKERHYPAKFVHQDLSKKWLQIKKELKELGEKLLKVAETNSISFKSNYREILTNLAEEKDIIDFLNNKIPSDKNDEWKQLSEQLNKKKKEALKIYAEHYYSPYLSVLEDFENVAEEVKKREEVIFIEDVAKELYKSISNLSIPDIYLRLGGRLYHYFIDEFQDTSQIQWLTLKTLIVESLSNGGSLFVVGDPKQAIYSFRDTDFTIMKALANKCDEEIFNITRENYHVHNLIKNYRCGEVILNYVKEFLEKIPKSDGIDKSGLFDWDVDVDTTLKGRGYVKAKIITTESTDDKESEVKNYFFEILKGLEQRNIPYADITILAHKNKELVNISSWLSEAKIPFLSYSSLDIRKRKVIQELITFLKFLDNPKDNQSLAFFLAGMIFEKIKEDIHIEEFLLKNKDREYLYKAFQNEYEKYWNTYFDKPFKYVGYLPLYELLCFIIKAFKIDENFSDEAGAIAKLLEIIKDLEIKGKNSLKEFLDFLETKEENDYESSNIFELPIPQNAKAIKLMTVHQAKGLGFPVVIYFLYPNRTPHTSLKIANLENGLKVLKITKKYDEDSLQNIYKHIELKEKINNLNTLYVGLTRAKDELYLIGIKSGNRAEFPVKFIIECERGKRLESNYKNYNHDVEESLALTLSDALKIQHITSDKLAYDEKRRGEFIHLILSKIIDINLTGDEEINNIIKQSSLLFPGFDIEKIKRELKEFIFSEQIKPFFNPQGGKVFVEKEFVDFDGSVVRIDRVLILENKIIVIDYKTGEKEEKYEEQLKRYGDLIKTIYKKPVECYILYFDTKDIVKVYEC